MLGVLEAMVCQVLLPCPPDPISIDQVQDSVVFFSTANLAPKLDARTEACINLRHFLQSLALHTSVLRPSFRMSDTLPAEECSVSPLPEPIQPAEEPLMDSHVQQIDSVLHGVKSRLHAIAGDWKLAHIKKVDELQRQHEAQRQEATDGLQQQLEAAKATIAKMKTAISKERGQVDRLAGAWHSAVSHKVRHPQSA